MSGEQLGFDRPSRLPAALAALALVITAALAYALVRADLDPIAAGDTVYLFTGPWKFLFVIPVVSAGVVYAIARRLNEGPAVERDEFALFFTDLGPKVGAYREATEPKVKHLRQQLEADGFVLDIQSLGGADRPAGAAVDDMPLAGAQVLIRARRTRARRAGIILRISPPGPGGQGRGLLETSEITGGVHEELARLVILHLGEMITGTTYRRASSRQAPEPTASIQSTLSPPRQPKQ